MGIYEQGKLLGLDKPLSHEERTYIEEVLRYYNKHSFVHRSLLRLLCAERKANEKESDNHDD